MFSSTTPLAIAVGSQNPVKIQAVTTAVSPHFPNAIITAHATTTTIPDMPLTDAESLAGARQRARAAQAISGATFGCGLEGHVYQVDWGWLLSGWAVIYHISGQETVGGCPRLPFPDRWVPRLQAGEELGDLMDDVLQTTGVRRQGGAIGTLTSGQLTRHDAFAAAVAGALAPFVAPHFYTNGQMP